MGWNHGDGSLWKWVSADTGDNPSVPGQTVIRNVECAGPGKSVLLRRICHLQQRVADAGNLPIAGDFEPFQANLRYRALVGEYNNGAAFDEDTLFWDVSAGDVTFGHYEVYSNRTTSGFASGDTAPDNGSLISSYPLGDRPYGIVGKRGLVVGSQPYEGGIHGVLVVFDPID
jgi:hypothetical protein